MPHRFLTQKLGIVALLLAAFVIVPVMEASACAFETETAYLDSVSPDLTSNPAAAPDGDHDTCIHGHCHHTASHVPPGTLTDHADLPRQITCAPDNHFLSRTPDGLIRPPKA